MNTPNVPSPPKERPLPKDSADDIWLYPRKDSGEFIQISGYVGRWLAIQAGLNGKSLRDWIIQVLWVSLIREEEKNLEPVTQHGPCIQLDIDDELQKQIMRVYWSQDDWMSPAYMLYCHLGFITEAVHVRLTERRRGEAPDTVAACLISESSRDMERHIDCWEADRKRKKREAQALEQAIEAGDFDKELRIAGLPRK